MLDDTQENRIGRFTCEVRNQEVKRLEVRSHDSNRDKNTRDEKKLLEDSLAGSRQPGR